MAIISLASALGKAYENAGQSHKASEKFNELVELIGPEEQDPMDEKDKNIRRMLKLMFALDIPTGEAVERSDPLIGPEVSLEGSLRAYLAFNNVHPQLCKKEDVALVRSRVERLAEEREAREKQAATIANFKPTRNSKSATQGSSKSITPEIKQPTTK